MKLVIDIRLINASGIGTYLKNIIPGIIDAFDKVIVLGNVSEIQLFEWSKKVKVISFTAKIYSIKEQIEYPFVVPKCDILWCPFFNVPIFPVKGAKIVTTIHDVYHLSENASISFFKKKYAQLLFKNAVRKSNLIFTISKFSQSEILKYTKADPSKIELVYCGVNEEFFKNTKAQRDLLYLPEKYILYVGNVKPHKNLIVLLKAYITFNEEFKSKFPIIFIGKKEGFITGDNEIQFFIKNNDLQKHITFTGYVEDAVIPNIYSNASLFVFPSLYEGFGLPILEALASGTKVLSSNAASLPEVGGDAVLYFDPKNHLELADKIKNSLESKFLTNNAEIQLKKFTWKKSIEKHLQGFKKLQ